MFYVQGQLNFYKQQFSSLEAIVRQAGGILKTAVVTTDTIHEKEGPANFVTNYDVQIQKFLIERITSVFPDASFYGEEDTERSSHQVGEGLVFFIDPIDGTTNFMFGYQHSCVSVGAAFGHQVIAGYVYNPFTDTMYSAIRGKGAWMDGRKLCIRDRSIVEGITAFGCARYNDEHTDILFTIVKELYLRSLAVRNGGSAALDLCRVASGANVCYLELKLQPYDYAAASVIIEEAGGRICQIDGSAVTLDGPCSVVGGSPKGTEEIQKLFKLRDD